MKPLVHHNKMSDITKAEQQKLCRCSHKCQRFVIISYIRGPVLTMCEKEAKRYIEEIAMAMGFTKPNFVQGARPWTDEEIEQVRKHYSEHKGKYGSVKLLAATMNRTPRQIVDKARRLKRKGEL